MRDMKDSGVEWIGKIPEGWKVSKIKYVAEFCPNCQRNFDAEEQVGYLPMECLKSGYMLPRVIEYGAISSGLTYFQNGDIVMAKVTPCFENGNIAIATELEDGAGFGSSELFVFRSVNIETRFLFYCLQCESFKNASIATMTGTGGLKRVSPYFVQNCPMPSPSIEIQRRIANFLDAKCAQIDVIIQKKQQVIEKLKAYKQSLITEAVTKGLDPTVLMKDSGVWWVGAVPKHWKVGQLKYFAKIRSGITLGKKYPADVELRAFPYLRVANVQGEYTDLSDVTAIEVPEDEAEKYLLHAGELLMTEGGDRDKLGRGCVWNGEIEVCLHQNHVFAVMTDARKLDVHFLDYMTTSDVARNYFDYTAKKTTNLASTNSTTILEFRLPVPDLEEQKGIVEYLDKKSAQINVVISKETAGITRLADYKKSLIYETVTGKMEEKP